VTDRTDTATRPEKPIPVDLKQPLLLTVHNASGNVTVRAADRGDVRISHTSIGLPGDLGDDEAVLLIDARNNRIDVRPNPRLGAGWAGEIDLDAVVGQISKAFRWGGMWSSAKPGKVRVASGRHGWSDIAIDIEMPRAITGRVEVHTASGDVRIEDITAEIELHTMSGDMRVVRTSGDLVLQTASGDLAVEGSRGRLSVRTASGDVRVGAARSEGFEIQTAAGDSVVDALLAGDGPCRVQSASGDVHLTLRRPAVNGEEPAVTLAFHTVSGDAHVTPPFRKVDRRLWRAGPGDRGPRIDVTTVSGDLSADIAAAAGAFVAAPPPPVRVGDAPPAPPAPPEPPAAPAWPSPPPAPEVAVERQPYGAPDLAASEAETEGARPAALDPAARLAVLEAVERGEIDVEEALRRLVVNDSTVPEWGEGHHVP
jgi:hypothetical protein